MMFFMKISFYRLQTMKAGD